MLSRLLRRLIRRRSSRTACFDRLGALPVMVDRAPSVAETSTLAKLARDHGLGVYDASYLMLARTRGLPLATLDRVLPKAAARMSVRTLP